MGASARDLFLSYNSTDRDAVVTVRHALTARGVSTFYDRDDLSPGRSWFDELEAAMQQGRGAAVFIGKNGLGTIQKREMQFALVRQAIEEKAGGTFPVIPVLLKGADPDAVSGFLALNTWIDLRSGIEDPLALDSLVNAIRRQSGLPSAETTLAVCPYRGLNAFREEDAFLFFGRQEFSGKVFEQVLARRFVAMVGRSGCGKSSIAKAGLLPLLRRQKPPSDTWEAVLFSPSNRPFHRLAAQLVPIWSPEGRDQTDIATESEKLGSRLAAGEVTLATFVDLALRHLPDTTRLIAIVDQFEELFTQTLDKEQQQRFVGQLVAASRESALTVLVTLRADFYGQAIGLNRELSDLMAAGIVNVGDMTAGELVEAIQRPALLTGLHFESGLVDRILEHVRQQPGSLPLLEYALTELWQRRQDHALTHQTYDAIGGVEGAIARRAQAQFNKLTSAQKEIALPALSRLVRLSAASEEGADTRQAIRISELAEDAKAVMRIFAESNARLVVAGRDPATGDETIEIAHEALIRGWSDLKQWIDKDREFLLWRQQLRPFLEKWRGLPDHKDAALLQGIYLAEARQWLRQRSKDLSAEERRFIMASEKPALGTRWRTRIAAVAALLVVGTVWFALRQESIARSTRSRESSLLVARSAEARDQSEALGLAIRAWQTAGTREAHNAVADSFPQLSAILQGHTDRVWSAAFSPDGQRIVTASDDNTARVWNAANGQLLATLQGHTGPVLTAIFSPDGLHAVTTSSDKTARVWNAAGGELLASLLGHSDTVIQAAFSPDGLRIVTASSDHTARVWNAASGQLLSTLEGHTSTVYTAAFSPDGQRIATASSDQTVRVWNAASGQLRATLQAHTGPVRSALFSLDGQRIVTASEDKTARVWNAASGQLLAVLQAHTGIINSAVFSPDGQRVVTASDDTTARMWNAVSGQLLATLQAHTGPVRSALFSPDGQRIVTASQDKTARVWNAASGQLLVNLRGPYSVQSARFSPDGQCIVTATEDKSARVWSATSGQLLATLQDHTGRVLSAVFSPDGRHIVTASWDRTARVWNAASGQLLSTLQGHTGFVTNALFSLDGHRIVTASQDNTARVWNATSGQLLATLQGHTGFVNNALFSPDGQRIVTASQDSTARVWNAASGQLLATLQGHTGFVYNAVFSPDGQRVVTASEDNTARVWNAATGQLLVALQAHTGPVRSARFSPDGQRIVTASEDKTARVWNAASGQLLATLEGHTDRVWSAVFSPDGQRIVTASQDNTARVWNAAGGQLLATLQGHRRPVYGAVFSPDGRRIVTASADKTARVWNAASGQLLAALQAHSHNVRSADFSPDGHRIVTASDDHTARVFRLVTLPEIADLLGK